MTRIVKNEILVSLDFSNFNICVECIKGKYTKIKKKGTLRATEFLECIHLTFGDPILLQLSMDISTSLLLLMTVYLVHEKIESLNVFKICKPEVENKLN